MMERLLDAAQRSEIRDEMRKADKTLRAIHDWFAEDLEIKEERTESGIEAGASAEASGSYLASTLKLLVSAKGYIRRADKRLHRKTSTKPQRLGELADRCNLLIRQMKQVLHGLGRKLLIIVEDLDKVSLQDARRMFLEQSAVLAELNTNMVCTIPIFLLHSPDRGAFEQHFDVVELPMLKVCEFDGSDSVAGRQAICQIIERRMDLKLISKDALALLIESSGGVLRDVFEILIVAAGAAQSLSLVGKQEQTINSENVRYGLNRRKTEYARAISSIDLPKEWQLTVADLYKKLKQLQPKPVRVLPSEPTTMVLLKSRAVLEYNGKGWFALHPLVRELLDAMPDDGPPE